MIRLVRRRRHEGLAEVGGGGVRVPGEGEGAADAERWTATGFSVPGCC